MKISVVTTLYYSAPYIEEFHQRITAAVQTITTDYEIIYVNDGSPDDVMNIADMLYGQDPHVCVIDLTRNFGHHKAAMTGLAHADGDLIFLVDVDLEEPPELLIEFYNKLTANPDIDVVYGQMVNREGSWFRKATGTIYYKLLNRLTGLDIPPNTLMARLMTRRYTYHLLQHRERRYSFEGLWQITGYRQIAHPVKKEYKGQTTYNLRKRIALAVDGITSLSNKPLIYIAYLGALLMIPSGLYIIYVLAQWVMGISRSVFGWTSVIVSIWFLGGLNIFVLGVIAIYISVIFDEVKPRPYTIVRQISRHSDGDDSINPSLVQNPELHKPTTAQQEKLL